VEYFLFGDNPHRAELRRLHGREVSTGTGGSFELVGLPGRGLVAARAAKDRYLVGQGAATIAGADNHGWFLTDPQICQPEFFHAIVAIDPAPRTDSLTCELALDPGKSRAGSVVGPDGEPLAGCVAINLFPPTMSQQVETLTSAAFTANALDPKHARHLFFRHHEKKLAAVVEARGDENGPLAVRLQPSGSVTGRIVDDDGRPATGVAIKVNYGPGQFADVPYFFTLLEAAVGNDGRFRIDGLIAGVVYDLDLRAGAATGTVLGDLAKGIKLPPGEVRDLGDLKLPAK
jgi:hypothetical protein